MKNTRYALSLCEISVLNNILMKDIIENILNEFIMIVSISICLTFVYFVAFGAF